jgi:hypothetical protein
MNSTPPTGSKVKLTPRLEGEGKASVSEERQVALNFIGRHICYSGRVTHTAKTGLERQYYYVNLVTVPVEVQDILYTYKLA